MTENDILDAIGDIDPAYLEEAQKKPVTQRSRWIRMGSIAACLVLFLVVPLGIHLYLLNVNSYDYAPQSYQECDVYYLEDHAIVSVTAGVWGGDAEMFEVWKNKNGIDVQIDLKIVNVSVSHNESADGNTVYVTVPASMEAWFTNEDGVLRLEALKKTIASYRSITIDRLEMIYA
jgi:hypothetical protein